MNNNYCLLDTKSGEVVDLKIIRLSAKEAAKLNYAYALNNSPLRWTLV